MNNNTYNESEVNNQQKSNKFLNIKIGIAFYNCLNSHITFQNNWKAISPAYYFLQRIHSYNESNDGKMSRFASILIMNIFRPYTNGEYKKYLNALVDLNLLDVDKNPNNNKEYYNVDMEESKSYLVTEKGIDLLLDSSTEYLKKLHSDKAMIRRNQKNISRRKVMSKTYGDYVLHYIHDGLINFKYDYQEALDIISGWAPTTKAAGNNLLISFKEKDFTNLHYNEVDNRVYNEFVGMKSDLRKSFTYKNMKRVVVLDIRACHPTFFACYIMDSMLYNTSNVRSDSTESDLPRGSLDNTVLSTSTYFNTSTREEYLHIVTDNVDNVKLQNEKVSNNRTLSDLDYKNKLSEEILKWNNLFCNPEIDPREIIKNECGYDDLQTVKDYLNESINGSELYKPLLRWLDTHFPEMVKVWNKLGKKITGPEISKRYETRIMLDPKIYQLAESMDLKLAYEYDGFSIFSSDTDLDKLMAKIETIKEYINTLSKSVCGFELVIKTKLV